jgi:hypothetical protein
MAYGAEYPQTGRKLLFMTLKRRVLEIAEKEGAIPFDTPNAG